MRTLARQTRTTTLARASCLLDVLVCVYFFTWALTGFSGVALFSLGVARSEAALIGSLLGFPLFLAVSLFVLVRRRFILALGMLSGMGAVLLWATKLLVGGA